MPRFTIKKRKKSRNNVMWNYCLHEESSSGIYGIYSCFYFFFFPLKNGDITVYIFNFVNTLEYDELPDDDGFTLKNLGNVVTWQANNLLQNSIQLLLSYIPAKYNKQIFPPFYFISFSTFFFVVASTSRSQVEV